MLRNTQEKQNIIGMALEAGFALSTGYGQEEGKLMPISDRETLQKFAQMILTSQLNSLIAELEEKKKSKRADFGRETSWEMENKNGYREGISDAQNIIRGKIDLDSQGSI